MRVCPSLQDRYLIAKLVRPLLEQSRPHLLQLALIAREFGDVIVFRSPPLAMQRALFGVLTPIAHWRGYRATYPQLSRTVLAPRT